MRGGGGPRDRERLFRRPRSTQEPASRAGLVAPIRSLVEDGDDLIEDLADRVAEEHEDRDQADGDEREDQGLVTWPGPRC